MNSTDKDRNEVHIAGAGLAGSEAALQMAARGWHVHLYEMRPDVSTPAHRTGFPAELVCSNSLKSDLTDTASGLLKREMELLGCILLPIARRCAVSAGSALAVDRDLFARAVSQAIESHPFIHLHRREIVSVDQLPRDVPVILATGPLTSDALAGDLASRLGSQLYFFDAIAPVVEADSLDRGIVFEKSRYDKGEADYLNCPFTREAYQTFVDALNQGEKHQAHEFEDGLFAHIDFRFYENCIPIEELARRGADTLRFGVMRPVGLEDPQTGKRPYAVIQLRAENNDRTAFNLVGCQTMLRQGEQRRVFRLIPGLENAEFLRYGSIHRNTFLNAPAILNPDLSFRGMPHVYVAGQLSGLEGYVESIFGGLLTALSLLHGGRTLPETTIAGGLQRHLGTATGNYQPMNANFGLLPPPGERIRAKKERKGFLAERSLTDLRRWLETKGILG